MKLNDELRRIERLPRRVWSQPEIDEAVETLTEMLRTPNGTQRLREIQAIALHEIATLGGMAGPIPVGKGKTLLSFLAPIVADAKRPLLVIPAKLVDKTKRAMKEAVQHWQIQELPIMTYEWLGRVQAASALEDMQPDMVVCDESHRLKNKRAAVTRRFVRYFKQNPTTKFVPMSGTFTKRSLLDYAHLLLWSLGEDNTPLPNNYSDLELWSDALDERKGQMRRADPGGLRVLCNQEEYDAWESDPREYARRAFRRRLIETPGVVTTQDVSVAASINISIVEPVECADVNDAFKTLRTKWETPDGHPFADAIALFRHARELALGFYYVWDPRPPRDWLDARRTWCAYARNILSNSRTIDSEAQVKDLVEARGGAPELTRWLAIKDTFEPHTVPVWLDHSSLEIARRWLEDEEGLVWTEHVHFAQKLSELSGIPYFGRLGRDAKGRPIELYDPGGPAILSMRSNNEGRNLQAWSKNMIISPPANGQEWEQIIGRTHRDGQEADEVSFDVACFCFEHIEAFWQAMRDAAYVHTCTGAPQKLLLADHNFPTEASLMFHRCRRWAK